MRLRHFLVLAAAAILAAVMAPTAAQADTRFLAHSGDSCRYGVTQGVLIPRTPAVVASGVLTDRPTVNDPGVCRDDGFFSVATFTALAGGRIVDTQAVRANNNTVRFELVLGSNSVIARIDTVVIQVCRNPINTLPPSYCGPRFVYTAPF